MPRPQLISDDDYGFAEPDLIVRPGPAAANYQGLLEDDGMRTGTVAVML